MLKKSIVLVAALALALGSVGYGQVIAFDDFEAYSDGQVLWTDSYTDFTTDPPTVYPAWGETPPVGLD